MPRTKKCKKRYTHTRRVRKGGGFMNLIRSKKKNDDKSKIDLIILALGGMDEVIRRAKSNEDKLKEKLKNEVQNPVVDDDKKDPKSDPKLGELRPSDPPAAKQRTPPQMNVPILPSSGNMPIGAAAMPQVSPMVEPQIPPRGGRRSRKRIKK